ncbi:MAG: dialkylresorcinol condensing enzyme [Gammaproteobacteria bacterium]|nr:dialkylresorcinol condensing enzyme [Gammaproteobacteria bacterium]
MTRILVLHFSQTGQLTRALEAMLAPLRGRNDVEIIWQNLEPVEPFPFPWGFFRFFDTFPECVHLDPPPIRPVGFAPSDRFDLVILSYQVWFLSPSLPVTAFLKSPAAAVLRNTPVITFIACRNMWLSAQEKVKGLLAGLGARLIDNVVLTDQGPPWATFITTPRWVLTGRRNGFWGIFPPAGVSDAEIAGASRFGRALADGLNLLKSDTGSMLSGLGAVKVYPGYIAGEKLAHRSFLIWGKLLRAIGRPGNPMRRLVLVIYIVFLVTMILTVMPVSMLVRALLRPFLRGRLDAEVARLESPSGSSTERLAQYR